MNETLITISKVAFTYPGGKSRLGELTMNIGRGDFLGICGLNGSGKSTFTYLLNGLIPQYIQGDFRGEVRVKGVSTREKNIAYFAGIVGMVFQNPDFSIFNLSVRQEILFGIKNLRLDNPDDRIKKALMRAGISGFENRDPQQLSLGEKQKVCLAAVLALEPECIVLDEPTSLLDYKSSAELYKLLNRLNEKGITIIAVEHDTDFLFKYAKTMLILDKGIPAFSGSKSDMLKNSQRFRKLGIKI